MIMEFIKEKNSLVVRETEKDTPITIYTFKKEVLKQVSKEELYKIRVQRLLEKKMALY